MKSLFLISAAMVTAAISCTNSQSEAVAFATDSVKFENRSKAAEVEITADFPKTGDNILKNAIAEYISESLGGTYSGNVANSDSMLDYYGKAQVAELEKMAKEYESSATPTMYYSKNIKKETETDTYVTYTDFCETFLGGAHGMHTLYGTTFRKSDGRRFGTEMLRDTDKENFRKLIKEGLK